MRPIGLSSTILAALLIPGPAAEGAVIADGILRGDIDTAEEVRLSTGQDAYTLSYTDGFGQVKAADFEGAVTTQGIKLFVNSTSSTYADLSGSVVDTYTVQGGTPGTSVSARAVFTVEGTSTAGFAAESRVHADIGRALDSNGSVLDASPVISNSGGGVDDLFYIVELLDDASRGFSHDLAADLQVEVGSPFQLAFRAQISHTLEATTDMLGTASVRFELPPGQSITSQKGFGTTAVPLPPAVWLLPAALAVALRPASRGARHWARKGTGGATRGGLETRGGGLSV